ncbi:MAG: magnesium transporter [Candidatus Latescibacteria bacterium]|nr:magnesium transporter [Candidatus Latescibacterota bacterium]NIM21610.1 magnesium transporter [Candidatus Latescibacterota bacterium]NIM64589.1 magnesium transporter [Candidatus Latescibacterota bacterium]NIO01104.1 magnesium transporter [Candidatus Latescibacterota bacterium]NIO27497.1 magnesium transporter [Candidatus Latescibacterota bacterium]
MDRPSTPDIPDVIARIRQLLEKGDMEALSAELKPLHPADIADVVQDLDGGDQVVVLKLLGNERAAEVLTEIDEFSGQALLKLLTDREVVSLLGEMPSDDAVDIISSLPPEKSEKIEAMLPQVERERLQELLEFEEDTAGGIMEVESLAVRESATIQDAITLVRESADEIENVQKIYVVDQHGVLKGAVAVLDLIRHPPDAPVAEVMMTHLIKIPVDMDQEEVASQFGKYDEFALPVVDKKERLIGRITVDDIIDVMEEEASEDIAWIAGTREEEIGDPSPIRISRSRLPWLVAGLIGEILNAILMSRYEVSIQTAVTLAFFIPLLMGTAGNIGSQAAVVVVRELALGEIDVGHAGRRVLKELVVALLNGVILGFLLFAIVYLWRRDPGLGGLLWVSLVSVMFVAAFIGASVPLLLHRLKVDPAIATGPFITVSNDIIGLAIYMTLATYYVSLVGS